MTHTHVPMYHLAPRAHFESGDPAAPYVPEAFAQDGFVHCTDGEHNVIEVGNRYYRDDARPFVALLIDKTMLRSDVRYEDPARIYPHVYGPLDRAAIVAVAGVVRDAGGAFLRLEAPPTG